MENIPWVLLGVVWLVNMFISWVNARTVGLMWVETKEMGGWSRFMTWMGAIMSASGFTWCYLVILLFGGYYAQFSFLKPNQAPYIGVEALKAGFALGYLIIVPGILFSGLMIWVDSLVQAWRRRDLSSMGIAAWNTFAQVHNTYGAIRGVPGAWDAVGDFFGGKDKKDGSVVILLLVILALLGGILTTWGIVLHYAGTRPLPQRTQ
jgi:hypothetical protein